MPDCECLDACHFFDDYAGRFGPVEPILRESLCHNEGLECARYRVFAVAGPSAVPHDLFPNDVNGATRIIERSHR